MKTKLIEYLRGRVPLNEGVETIDFVKHFLTKGRAYEKGFTEKDADPKELEMGIKVEMEHTDNKDISKRIAIDHLAECKDYYTRLAKMEKECGVKG